MGSFELSKESSEEKEIKILKSKIEDLTNKNKQLEKAIEFDSLLRDIVNSESYYEVGYEKMDSDIIKYTPLAIVKTEDNAIVLTHCLNELDEDPGTKYFYTKIKDGSNN